MGMIGRLEGEGWVRRSCKDAMRMKEWSTGNDARNSLCSIYCPTESGSYKKQWVSLNFSIFVSQKASLRRDP
jgi:hypothetical protein